MTHCVDDKLILFSFDCVVIVFIQNQMTKTPNLSTAAVISILKKFEFNGELDVDELKTFFKSGVDSQHNKRKSPKRKSIGKQNDNSESNDNDHKSNDNNIESTNSEHKTNKRKSNKKKNDNNKSINEEQEELLSGEMLQSLLFTKTFGFTIKLDYLYKHWNYVMYKQIKTTSNNYSLTLHTCICILLFIVTFICLFLLVRNYFHYWRLFHNNYIQL